MARVAFVLSAACLAACSQDPSRVCEPGATQLCVCTGGREGAQSCNSDGSAWEPCLCESAPDRGPARDLPAAVDRPVTRDLPPADRPRQDARRPDSAPPCGTALNADCCPGNTCSTGFKCFTLGLKPQCKIVTGYTGCAQSIDCISAGNATSAGLTCENAKCCFKTGSVACVTSVECCNPLAVCEGAGIKSCVIK